MSIRDLIRQADDLNRESVDIPEWGQTVYVQSMSAKQRHRWEQVLSEKGKDENLRLYLIINFVIDGDGNRVFEDADASWLEEKNSGVISMLAMKILEKSAATNKSIEDAAGK